MNKTVCFVLEESLTDPNKYMITPIHENFRLKSTNGSYNIICARVLGLTYASYLRFCRDILGAKLVGKNTKYPIALFDKTREVLQFVKTLNSCANAILLDSEVDRLQAEIKRRFYNDN